MKKLTSKINLIIFNYLKTITLQCFRLFNLENFGVVYFVTPKDNLTKVNEIKKRYRYFLPNTKLKVVKYRDGVLKYYFNVFCPLPFIISDAPYFHHTFKSLNSRNGIFNMDYENNPQEGWEWHRLLNYISKRSYKNEVAKSYDKFQKMKQELLNEGKKKSYVFGTGPSLEKARLRQWRDGYNIVCNTIVKDESLWKHINPDIIVAGDAIYHFGFTQYAKQFRKDLKIRLAESSTFFIYPYLFDEFIYREFSEFRDRLIPIPIGKNKEIYGNLSEDFELPNLGNVLSLLLLPLACNLSKDVYLWGFDGRAPNDKGFWANSANQTYSDLIGSIRKAHPAFFDHYMPTSSEPNKYVKLVHGDELERCLSMAEKKGWKIIMMHKTWTETLLKRYKPNKQ